MKKIVKQTIKKNHFKYRFSFLEKHIMLKFLSSTKFQYGPLFYPQIRSFCIGTRQNHVLFNLYFLISQIRKMLYMIHLHSYTKELIVILAANQPIGLGYRIFYLFTYWVPGFLTNFKRLMRRALAETRYRKKSRLNKILSSALYVKRTPQLPTLTVSLSAHNHWFYNEGHHLGLIQFTNSETLHSNILIFNQTYLPVTITLRLIRETIFAARLDDRLYFKHYLIKKVNKKATKKFNFLKF